MTKDLSTERQDEPTEALLQLYEAASLIASASRNPHLKFGCASARECLGLGLHCSSARAWACGRSTPCWAMPCCP